MTPIYKEFKKSSDKTSDTSSSSDTSTSSSSFFFAFSGAMSIVILNVARHRPLTYQPWLHVIAAGSGAYLGSRLNRVYEDTTDAVNREFSALASLPSWAYSKLSPENLESELKGQRLAETAQKFEALAVIEEKEYKAKMS